ncbi:MAG: hypothetical protein JWM78_2349 [Verrucomicrobiaceae bacterium]|nr:hypothetical protein [Verrucomicrobiaceae bacterium]
MFHKTQKQKRPSKRPFCEITTAIYAKKRRGRGGSHHSFLINGFSAIEFMGGKSVEKFEHQS